MAKVKCIECDKCKEGHDILDGYCFECGELEMARILYDEDVLGLKELKEGNFEW